MKIKQIKKVGLDKYYLILDNNQKVTTYDEVILKYNLLYKKEIDKELLEVLMKETSFYDVYHKVVKYISTRLRSELEIKKYLEKFGLTEKEENGIFTKLRETNLVNDQNFAKAFISDKVYLSTMGPLKIKSELLKHQIDMDIIEEEINKIDETIVFDKLYKLVSKKVHANKKHSNYMLRQKLLFHFKELGYENRMIEECLDACLENDNSVLEREATKIYSRLSKKYHGIELKQKVKEKLYQKGFDINEINKYLNEKEDFN